MNLSPRTVDGVMVEHRVAAFQSRSIKASSKMQALLLAMSMLDLTTLEGKDSPEKVRALCRKAARPAPDDEAVLGMRIPPVAAVCVYPAHVALARRELAGTGVKVASVATGFPSGQYPLEVRLEDVRRAIADGADEIDMVINRGAFLAGRLAEVGDEIEKVAEACCAAAGEPGPSGRGLAAERTGPGNARANGRHALAAAPAPAQFSPSSSAPSMSPSAPSAYPPPHLKVILETGELETYDNIRLASDLAVSILSEFTARCPGFIGFIKTSTGKVQPAATMGATLVMLESVRDEFLRTGRVVGVKPAGGIRAARQAVQYLVMVRETVGGLTASAPDAPGPRCPWLKPGYFRFGASTLANDILRQVYRLKTGRYMAGYDFSEP